MDWFSFLLGAAAMIVFLAIVMVILPDKKVTWAQSHHDDMQTLHNYWQEANALVRERNELIKTQNEILEQGLEKPDPLR